MTHPISETTFPLSEMLARAAEPFDEPDNAKSDGLLKPRLQRAIGAVYRPEDAPQCHYYEASLPEQFDEYIWINETSPVRALPSAPSIGLPASYPFGH
jgi:protein-L-isoaspartate(D-aspartate) O-methyltransferase